MKIAVFGDVHGNIEALRAAYNVVAKKADKICHLGDLGGYCPFVNEVVEFLIEHDIRGAQGNYDDAVGNDKEHCGCKFEDSAQSERGMASLAWTKQRASSKTKKYLRELPAMITFEYVGKKIALFHASPHKNNLYWHEDRPEKFFKEMAKKIDADIMVYGHIHKPYRKDVDGKIFINTGSVGMPKDGDRRACAVMIEVNRDSVQTEFLRIEYDVEKTAAAIIESGLPAYFAEGLKHGT
jgi:putative phosphoesterase